MRRNLYILAQCTFLLFITLLVNGCSLHEEPEMTPEGELGVDPTAVTLNLNLAMNLSLAERCTGDHHPCVGNQLSASFHRRSLSG